MIINRVFASYTFRFMSAYVACLSVAVFIVLAIIYATFSYDYFTSVHTTVTQELEEFNQTYQEGGVASAEQFIAGRLNRGDFNRFFYLIVDGNNKKVVGNLNHWPDINQYSDGWLGFELNVLGWDGESVNADFVARSIELDDGHKLLTARHYDDVISSAKLVSGALIRSMIATIVLGTIGGAIVAGLSVKRIDHINKSVKQIMEGDLSQRIVAGNHQGDFRELSFNLNRMLDRIQSLMESMRQVSDNVAHDLRTPLTRLRNGLSRLHGQVDSSNTESVEQLIEEADGLLATFSALLRIAQVESGNRRSGFVEVDAKTILLDVIELYEPLAMDKHLDLQMDLAEGLSLMGDRDLLFQACANLIDNAIKYTPEGGVISVKLERNSERAVITIADSGVGISAQDKTKVFRRFYRVEASRGLQPGNGLGLSLVYAVIKLHDGEALLSDNYPGLKVEIELPITKA